MSEILDLAKRFEERSKEQAQDTEQSVKRVFERLNQSIDEALSLNEQHIKHAIQERNQRLSHLMHRLTTTTVLSIMGLAIALIVIMGGVVWYQGTIISARLSEIDTYNQQLANLKVQTGAGVEIYADEKQKNSYLLVLPKQAKNIKLLQAESGEQVVRYMAK